MTNLRWFLHILCFFIALGYCTDPRYYDNDFYSDCFQSAPGWYHITATCIFPLTQFERNYSTAIQMCGAVNHSIGYRETNWLIASQLLEEFTKEQNRELMKMYWTGLVIRNEDNIGVESEDATETTTDSVSDFTSIYNPLWALGQPSEDLSTSELTRSCVALDLRNSSNFGWRVLPCNQQLPILCQNYACIPGTFRCVDNSKCIPASFRNDGFKDCLDGSDETESKISPISSSTPNSLLSSILRENPVYEWPMIISSGGILSPSTVRYGRGECTHRWTVLSPNDQHFVIGIKWMTPTTSTTIYVEGKDQNGRMFFNSKNSTSSFTLLSSSFVLTASDTDTRKVEFEVYFQESDNSLCKISENQLLFDSETIPMPCSYYFSSRSPSSYVAVLIRRCEGTSPFVASIQFDNSTVSLSPSPFKKLLIIPSNSLNIHIDSTWPGTDTKLDIQFLELEPGAESVDVFLIDLNFEVEWIPKSNDVCMGGQFRTLTVNMILTSFQEDSENLLPELTQSTWRIERFGKSCSEDNVQIVSTNKTNYVSGLGTISGFGPTTLVIHQSAEPFEFHSIYNIQQSATEAPGRFLDVTNVGLSASTVTPVGVSTTTPRNVNRCKLPIVIDGFVKDVSMSPISYSYGTVVEISCSQGFMLDPLPFSLTCNEDGAWIDSRYQIYDGNHPTVQCYAINCPSETYFESQHPSMIPNNYDTFYGAIRRYQNVTPDFGFGPLCICGDDAEYIDEWLCLNTEGVSQPLIPNACILPQVNDAEFVKQSQSDPNIFPTGYTIEMKCLICPFLVEYYICRDGLWTTSEGITQPYGTFGCDCTGGIDPCEPHGKYVKHDGYFSCDCDKGYKFNTTTCVDINECEEQSDYCDRSIGRCHNTDGGFECICAQNFHIYHSATTNTDQWGGTDKYFIEGYSCIETTCAYSERDLSGLTVISPPSIAKYYKSGTSLGYSYALNLCNGEFPCVFQFQETCFETLWRNDPNPYSACRSLDSNIFDYQVGIPSFHVFQMIDLNCKDSEMLMIGRPKVFCNAQYQWEKLPRCIYQSCSNITNLVQEPLFINSIVTQNGKTGFESGTILYFGCKHGLQLSSNSGVSCKRFNRSFGISYEWDQPLPTCISTTTTGTSTFTHFTTQSSQSSTSAYSLPPANTPFTTISPRVPLFYDDVVIEGSMTFEETNVLDRPEMWTQTGDWIWTPSGCIVHQWTFPISFLVTSIPIKLNSDQIELLIDISQCNSSVQVGVISSTDGFIPPISEFRTVMNTTSSGSFVVKLRNLKPFLALSITSDGYVRICEVTVRENMCDEVDYNGLHLAASKPFSMRRYLSATCANSRRIAPINGYCDSRRGWVVQDKPCLCNTTPQCPTVAPIPQRDQSTQCDINSCQNGECVQFDGYFDCRCNELFVRDMKGTEPYCRPDHCSLTSTYRNSGYNCLTGTDDANSSCMNASLSGSFCQYEGKITNNTYIYILSEGSDNAIATNVCESADTEYAINGAYCSQPPPTTPATHDCVQCSGGYHCAGYDEPFKGGSYCYCNETYYGRSCSVSKACFDENDVYICLNGGTCVLNGPGTSCHCLKTFDGDHCEIPLPEDSCFAGEKDCVYGTCRRENDVVYCNCFDGYIRDSDGNCTISWDMCSMNDPCQQMGSCNFNSTSGKLSCDCRDSSGWHGDYCEVQPKFDDCSVCENNSTCLNSFSSNVRCQCSLGFSGYHCTNSINDCQFSPCFNSGTCNPFNYINSYGDLIESYNCTCATGYGGTNCELRVTPNCNELITCQNGGTCELTSIDTAVCNCTDQFYGTYCERACSDQCAHSYGCHQISNGTIECQCYPGYSDNNCDKVEDVCKANILICLNSGTCNPRTLECDCPDLYNGTYCENNLNKCETNSIICENGGTCIPETGICECPRSFTGPFCENQFHSCKDITCYNGGTCIEYNATCKCLPGTTGDRCKDLGQPCTIYNPDGSTTPYCVHGRCFNLPNGAACDCNGTEYTGRRCDTKANINFNLVFNGLDYAPQLVSKAFYNVSIAQFTICSFVQYNHPTIENSLSGIQDVTLPPLPPWLTMRGHGRSQQIVFDNNGFFICDPNEKCSREEVARGQSYFKPTPITANTWHHFCLVSPSNLTSPNYIVYLDGVRVDPPQLAPNFNPGQYGYLELAPTNITKERFEGMISMTQLYIIRLNESQIGKLAFDCLSTISDTNSMLSNNTLINWNGGFTRVSSSNPGVFIDPAGICSSVKCMFGRQAKVNNYNSTGTCDKDRIAPTVLRCPSNKHQTTTEDFTKVSWSDDEISFFDNIGVVRIVINYHNGQQFGIGITAVRYIAFDEAGNSAECTFDVIVSQKSCPSQDQTFVEGGTIRFSQLRTPYAYTIAKVQCNDSLYPIESRPRFYVCDIMGDYKYGGWVDDAQKKYYLPACGKTTPALQEINGTVVGSGTCPQVYQKLRDIIWTSANCDEIKTCRIVILPPCNETSSGFWTSRETQNVSIALQYTFSTRNAIETISSTVLTHLQSNFTVVRQDSKVECDQSFPIHDTTGNVTICVSCPEGTYANLKVDQCMNCPVNTYRSSKNTDQLSCINCPENTITGDLTGAVDESQCYRKCEIGQFESKGSCLPCPEGTFSETEGLRKCVCCGFDLSTFGTGKTSFGDCTKTCPSGQEMIRSETDPAPFCQDCEIGFYKQTDRGPCIQCPRGLTTTSTASKSIYECNVLHCIDANTMRNVNVTVGPNTTYSQMCITCEQGTYQTVPNSDHCIPCSDLPDDSAEVPVTCQSTCSDAIPTEGCNCQLQSGNNSMIIRNCVPEVIPAHTNSNAIKIVLPIVFGVLLIIVIVVLFFFRKQIIAWFRKTDTNDNQSVPLSHWNRPEPPTIPRPNLRIVTSPAELSQLPPRPPSSTPSFRVDSTFKNVTFSSGYGHSSSGMRHLGTPVSHFSPSPSSPNSIHPELDRSSIIQRNTTSGRKETSSDDSSLDSFF